MQAMVSKTHETGSSDSFVQFTEDGSLAVAMENVGWLVQPIAPEPSVWHHIAFTADREAKWQALYVDGVPGVSSAIFDSLDYDEHPILLGAEWENEPLACFFGGLIDEVSLDNRALTGTEIKSIYDAGSAGKAKPRH